jgi:hypothetical protein
MAMPETNDYLSQMNRNLHRVFGSSVWFGGWLDSKEQSGFAPADEDALGRDMLLGGAGAGHGQQVAILTGEILAKLKREGVDWGRAIRHGFEKAESEWPAVAESHRAVLGRIKKVWM